MEVGCPCHPDHPLQNLMNESDVLCVSCGELIMEKEECYHCSTCGDFRVHSDCITSPPPLDVVNRPRIHEHTLTLFRREVSFTCSACGLKVEAAFSYVCLPCGFMIHIKCIDLPRVIRINRHLHRIAHTFSLGSEKKLSCGVCHKSIDGRYGAYSSLEDPNFAVHSRCAIAKYLWDGVELEGVPEEKTLSVQPFIKTSHEKVRHFRHEDHELRRITNGNDKKARCYACNLHVYPDPFYKCVEVNCGFILHETCANLPLAIWSPIHQHTLTLFYRIDGKIFKCACCDHVSNGFRYSCSKCEFDVDSKCVSAGGLFRSGAHEHPLYLSFDSKTCSVCEEMKQTLLSCSYCEFALCFACANLPTNLLYEDDAHPLSLNHGGKAEGISAENLPQNYWCDCCETPIDPLKNFYQCSTYCGTVVHTKCATGGDLRNLRADVFFNPTAIDKSGFNTKHSKCQVFLSENSTRPPCRKCQRRCLGPSILRCCSDSEDADTYFCCLCCFICP